MAIILAENTINAINVALEKDQGATYRKYLFEEITQIADAFRAEAEDDFRSHLGASLIGRECDRELWLSFRWSTIKKFDGRMLRLFNRGHLEEARFIALLRTIGCVVKAQQEDGSQFRISDHGGHFGSALDAKVVGIPDLPPNEQIIGEFKTHSDKSFKKLKSSGVLRAKPEHYTQLLVYMQKKNCKYGLYLAVNKNDDELYGEILCLDSIGELAIERAGNIIFSDVAPDRLHNASPSWFACKFCDQNAVCYGRKAPERNCRTCRFSKPIEDGTWQCQHPSLVVRVLDKADQLKACPSYSANPSFI